MRHHQRRPVQLLDDFGHREGLPGTGDPEQHLLLFAIFDAARQFRDRRLLVALGTIIDGQLEGHEISIGDAATAAYHPTNTVMVLMVFPCGPLTGYDLVMGRVQTATDPFRMAGST